MIPRLKREIHVHGWVELVRPTFDSRVRRCISCGAVQVRRRGEWITRALPMPSQIETR
jgi:hypothetical protein